jgi:hypothetical protein
MQDILALSSLALLRFGVPLLVIAGAAYLLIRYSRAQMQADIQAPAGVQGMTPTEWAKAVTVPPVVPCWEQKKCDPLTRSNCAAYKRSHVPCWLAVQVAEGQLKASCQNCDMYRLEKRERPYIRVIKGRRQGAADVAAIDDGARQAGNV